MCSVGDDNLDELEHVKYMPTKEKLTAFTKCIKCRDEIPIVVLRSKDKYCRSCFLAATVHKFKSLLGKHKLIRPKDQVLVVYKCGHASTALLHFIRSGLDLDTHKKLRFEPVVLFLEDHIDLSLGERQALLKHAESEVAKYKFPAYFASLSRLLTCQQIDSSVLCHNSELLEITDNDANVVNQFVGISKNATNRTDLLKIRTQSILVKISKHLGCRFIFTPDISSDVASQLLSDIALGRGEHISLNSGFCDSRHQEVNILRPLRLFEIKELAFYNYLNKLEPVTHKIRPDTSCRSVQQVIKKFVNDLQTNYPATVTTVIKTGDKLALTNSSKTCHLCNAPLDVEAKKGLSSAESTQFSHWVSTQTPDVSITSQERYNLTVEAFKNLGCDNYCFACGKLQQ